MSVRIEGFLRILVFSSVGYLQLVAQTPQAFQDSISLDSSIKIGRLSNGLTYYIRKNKKPENEVELRLVVKVGSIVEDEDQQGLAHFTEHMAFNGTRQFKGNKLVDFLQSIGVRFGRDLNAVTNFDETIFKLTVPVDKPSNLQNSLLVLRDWADGIKFKKKEIEKERGVVLEEFRLRKGADDRMNQLIIPKLFEKFRYADRLPLGKEEVIANFKLSSIKTFYKDWYRPNLMAIILVGDIDPVKCEKLIIQHFETLHNRVPERPRENSSINLRKYSEAVVTTDPEARNETLYIYYSPKASKPAATLQDSKNQLLKTLINSMLNVRLRELTRDTIPPFLYAASADHPFVGGFDVYSSVTMIGKAGLQPAIQTILVENERARKFGFTNSEFLLSKKSFLRWLERRYSERHQMTSQYYVNKCVNHFLKREIIISIEDERAFQRAYLDKLSLETINSYASEILPALTDPKLVILKGPEKSDFKIPSNNALLQMVEDVDLNRIVPYSEDEVLISLMDTIPSRGKIVSERIDTKAEYTELLLSNNVRVILKPTTFKNDEVLMHATRPGGQSVYNASDLFNAAYSTAVIPPMGVADFSPSELRKILSGRIVNCSLHLFPFSENLNGQSGSSDIEILLQLIHLYFTKPRKDSAVFNLYIDRQRALLKNSGANPQTIYRDSISKILWNDHPRRPTELSVDDLDKIDVDRAMEIFKQRFGNANGFTFCFVGNFDLEKMKDLVELYLGSLPDNGPSVQVKDVGLRPIKGVVKREIVKGIEPKSFITVMFTGEAKYSYSENLKLSLLLDVLNIKLIEILRERLSEAYTAAIYGQLVNTPYEHYSITLSVPCGPKNVDELIMASFDQIESMKKRGPKESDLNKVIEMRKRDFKKSSTENSFWWRRFANCLRTGVSISDMLELENEVSRITVQDLKATANKYFHNDNYLQVVLNPEK